MFTSCRKELEKSNKVDENVPIKVEVDPNTVSNNQPIEVSSMVKYECILIYYMFCS